MIWEIEVSLQVWSFEKDDIGSRDLLRALGVSKPRPALPKEGSGRIILFRKNASAFRNRKEPAESFSSSIQTALSKAACWLEGIRRPAMTRLRRDGYTVDLLIDVCMDQDQLDLEMPPSLLLAAGRHGVPIAMTTRSWEIEVRLSSASGREARHG